MCFKGKVVIVTGASSGIGAATAILFAQRGANVVLVGRNIDKLEMSEKSCKSVNEQVETLIIKADVTLDTEKIINQTISKFGKLDVLVNNAGIVRANSFMNSNIEELDLLMNTNLRAVYILTKLAVPYLLKTKGNIVNVSSIAGLRAYSYSVNYALTKAALDQFTKCLALELASKQIRVNSVNPAAIETCILLNAGYSEEISKNLWKAEAIKHPIGRIGTVNEVANTITFLASDDASFITGSLLAVDGGRVTTSI